MATTAKTATAMTTNTTIQTGSMGCLSLDEARARTGRVLSNSLRADDDFRKYMELGRRAAGPLGPYILMMLLGNRHAGTAVGCDRDWGGRCRPHGGATGGRARQTHPP